MLESTNEPLSYAQIRKRLQDSLPKECFEPQRHRGVLGFVAMGICLGIATLVGMTSWHWGVYLLLSVVSGQLYVYAGFVNHESQHGSVFTSNFWKWLFHWVTFTGYFISPTTWKIWHGISHHGNTNDPQKDPDVMGLTDQVRKSWIYRFANTIAPGSGHWISYISMFVLFNFKGQAIVWYHSKDFPETFSRTRAKAESIAFYIFWFLICVSVGWKVSLFGLIIPILVANYTIMAYIATQHWMSPIGSSVTPLESTLSVRTFKIFDLLHANFSYHQEHHIFPTMSPRFAPLVRQKLYEIAPEAVFCTEHWRALYWLYASPRPYESESTLSHWKKEWKVDTTWLRKQMRT